jgi:hypothetical protein
MNDKPAYWFKTVEEATELTHEPECIEYLNAKTGATFIHTYGTVFWVNGELNIAHLRGSGITHWRVREDIDLGSLVRGIYRRCPPRTRVIDEFQAGSERVRLTRSDDRAYTLLATRDSLDSPAGRGWRDIGDDVNILAERVYQLINLLVNLGVEPPRALPRAALDEHEPVEADPVEMDRLAALYPQGDGAAEDQEDPNLLDPLFAAGRAADPWSSED